MAAKTDEVYLWWCSNLIDQAGSKTHTCIHNNLGKPAPERLNQSGFWWSKRWWGGSGICKSFAPCSRQITMPAQHLISQFPDAPPTVSKHWRQTAITKSLNFVQHWCEQVRKVISILCAVQCSYIAFSALTVLVGHQEDLLACKKLSY